MSWGVLSDDILKKQMDKEENFDTINLDINHDSLK